MATIPGYQHICMLKTFNEKIVLSLAEDNTGKQFEILTIQATNETRKLLERVLRNEFMPLLKKDIPGIRTLLEAGWSPDNEILFAVYDHKEGFLPISENKGSVNSVLKLANAIGQLKKDNFDGHYLSPDTVASDKNVAELLFVGIYEVFKSYSLLDTRWLSPEVQEGERPRFTDDIWSFAKLVSELWIEHAVNETILKAISDKREDRHSSWIQFLAGFQTLCQSNPFVHVDQHKHRDVIHVEINPGYEKELQKIISEMNIECHYIPDKDVSKVKGEITGIFYTQNWSGRLFVKADLNSINIPFSCCKEYNGSIPKNAKPLCFDFNLSKRSSVNVDEFFYFLKDENKGNNLNNASRTKKEQLKRWETIPKKEKEFIEEKALKLEYIKRETSKNNSGSIIFYLNPERRKICWHDVKKLKYLQVIISVNEDPLGVISEYNPKENFIILRDCRKELDEIPEKGELIQDVRMEVSQFKKQMEACSIFGKGDILNPVLCSMLATPDQIASPPRLNVDYEAFKEMVYNPKLKSDDTQRESVLEALHRKPLFLIQGPPGTGKTTVIVELIRQIIKLKPDVKILVTSQSNLAVDNVLERLPEEILYMRLASDEDKISNNLKDHSYETKLMNWIEKTRSSAWKNFETNISSQNGKGKSFYALYKKFKLIQQHPNVVELFRTEISQPTIPSYFRETIFKSYHNANDIRNIFIKNIGEKEVRLWDIMKNWEVFLDNATGNEKDHRLSKIIDSGRETDLKMAFVKSMNVLGATCIHIASSKYSKVDFKFDYVIMDESSKASPAEALVPINMGRNIILIGDHKQLPPVVTREEAVKSKIKTELEDNGLDFEKEFGESLFEKLITTLETDPNKTQLFRMLDIQYRMPSQIGELISKYFYNGKLRNPSPELVPLFDQTKTHGLPFKNPTSMVFVTTSTETDRFDNGNKTRRVNNRNILKIEETLSWLNKAYEGNLSRKNEKGEIEPLTIGIIAGYRGQVEELQKRIQLNRYANFCTKDEKGLDKYFIRINTVDKFQGAEEDIIIYDIVKSSPGRDSIGFLDDYRRINVAFSRVKKLLIVVGDSEYILKRASLNPSSRFHEFKLKMITEEFSKQALIVNSIEEMI